MKKIIFVTIIMAGCHEESNLEKRLRETKESIKKVDQEIELRREIKRVDSLRATS